MSSSSFGSSLRVLAAVVLLNGCEDHAEKKPPTQAEAMNQDPASEERTLQAMLRLLDERGLGFEEASDLPAAADNAAQQRAILELQTTLQTEIELLRRSLSKTDPASPNLALLGQVRTALDRHELGALVRSASRTPPDQPNDAALLFADLQTRVKDTLKRRLERLAKP